MSLTLQEVELCRVAAPIMRRAKVKDKAYRAFPIGQEAGRFLRTLAVEVKSENTLLSYETVLAALARQYPDFDSLEPFAGKGDLIIDFLAEHWSGAARATMRQRIAVLNSFFDWAERTGRISRSPMSAVRLPKEVRTERYVPPQSLIDHLVVSQPSLRDQAGLLLMGRLAFRRDELRVVRVGDFDLGRSTVAIHGKGGHVDRIPFGEYRDVRETLEFHLREREDGEEYLVYPKSTRYLRFSPAGIHNWFKRCLERAGVEDFPMHALRHAAIDEVRRRTGNIEAARQLARHASLATTERYLHASDADLIAAMREVERSRFA